jgi:hypothetical protein
VFVVGVDPRSSAFICGSNLFPPRLRGEISLRAQKEAAHRRVSGVRPGGGGNEACREARRRPNGLPWTLQADGRAITFYVMCSSRNHSHSARPHSQACTARRPPAGGTARGNQPRFVSLQARGSWMLQPIRPQPSFFRFFLTALPTLKAKVVPRREFFFRPRWRHVKRRLCPECEQNLHFPAFFHARFVSECGWRAAGMGRRIGEIE